MGRPLAEHYRRVAVGVLAQYAGKDHRVTRDVIGWLVAGPESQRTGVMRIHTGAIADDLGWTRAQVDAAIARLSADGQAVWSPEVRVIACRFVLDVLGISTTNHKTSAVNQIAALPDCEATRFALKIIQEREITSHEGALNAPRNAPRNAPSHGASNGAEKREERREKRVTKTPDGVLCAPAIAVADEPSGESVDASANAVQTNGNCPRTAASLFDDHTPASDQNLQPRAKRARTVAESPPTREATREFFERAGSSWAEADQCYDHHLARGWVSGRTPLKDWDAACRTWIANAKKYASQRGPYRSTKPVYDEAAVWTPEAKARAERESTGAF